MTFARYMRFRMGEYALVLLSAWCLSYVGFNAFFLDSVDAVAKACIAGALCAVLVGVLFAVVYRRTRIFFGIACYLALVAVLVGVSLALSSGDAPYVDAEGNYLYLAAVVICASTGSFLCTRTLPGCAVWFFVSVLVCSVIQAFYESDLLLPSAGATFSALALIIMRNFTSRTQRAESVGEVSQKAGFAAAAVPVLVSMAVAGVLWFAVIAPLNPGVLKVTLITDYRQLPVVELRGVADERPVLDLATTSQNFVDGFYYTTDDLVEGISDILINAKEVFSQLAATGGGGNLAAGASYDASDALDSESTEEEFDAMSFSQIFPAIIRVFLTVALIAALIALYFLGRRAKRKRSLVRMLSQPPSGQVRSLYLFLLGRLGSLGFAVPDGMTLDEFARSSRARMDTLTEATKVPFSMLTSTYVATAYGGIEPQEDDIVPFVAYYQQFWKAARRQLGTVRYFFRSFRL